MDLLEVLDEAAPTAAEPCKLGQILAQVTETQRELLAYRLANWSADKLAFNLKKTAYGVGATTIKLHRRQECGCFL